MAFPQKQQFVFKHFTAVLLSVLPTHFMHRLFTWSLVVRCLQNHPHFLTRSSYIPVRYVITSGTAEKKFVWGEMYSYSFTSGKTYLVIQTWRIVKWATTWQNQQSDCAPSEDSDQPGHPPSLIRVFAVRMKKTWVLSYPFSAQRRLWSDWADLICLRWAHTYFVGFVMSWLKWFRYPCYVNCVPTTLFNLSPSIFGGRNGILP